MTPAEYQSAGFLLSSLINQKIIDRAENDIINAYILPICPNLPSTSDLYKKAVMTLSFMLMCKRANVFMTRSGSKEKENQFSKDSDGWNNLQNLATDCHFIIEQLKSSEGANEKPKFIDICGIYFKTNFYHI